jgi:hypothetical protein
VYFEQKDNESIRFSFRPIAGNINVCPRRLRGDHNSIDFDRLVSTIKHEILHTLVIMTSHFKTNKKTKNHFYFLGLFFRFVCLLSR